MNAFPVRTSLTNKNIFLLLQHRYSGAWRCFKVWHTYRRHAVQLQSVQLNHLYNCEVLNAHFRRLLATTLKSFQVVLRNLLCNTQFRKLNFKRLISNSQFRTANFRTLNFWRSICQCREIYGMHLQYEFLLRIASKNKPIGDIKLR